MATSVLAGIVEGFYGRPWSHDLRLAYANFLPALGLNTYLYAPKADPWLRKRWQEHWPAAQWAELAALAAHYRARSLTFGVGLSPFALYGHYAAPQKRQLQEKISRLNSLEAPLLAVLFDDMPGAQADLAARQAEIVSDVRHWSLAETLLVCPTYYSFDPVLERHFGQRPAGYWTELGQLLDPEVGLFWTGNQVCSESITQQDLQRAVGVLGRPPVLWDNYPVNDGAQRSQHLYLEPLSGRPQKPGTALLRGHLCNPMLQGHCSLPALMGLARLQGGEGRSDSGVLDRLLGAPVWKCLQRDAEEFRTQGLESMSPERRQALAAEYAALPGGAAQEVVGWLRGEYVFDPACLTD